jgi:hypothetical protein
MVLPVDPSGRFCVRLSLPKDRYLAELEVRPSASLDGSLVRLPLDLSLRPVTLRFDPEHPVLDLDEESTDLEVFASTEEDGTATAASGLWLGLENESGAMLGGAMTSASGRARFVVTGARLGQPGRGELRATFAGNADFGPCATSLSVERRTLVDLIVTDAKGGRRSMESPEDGFAIPIVAAPRCSRFGCVGLPTGAVEARVGETIVGAAMLERGAAQLVATFAMSAAEVPLSIRYEPGAPWFRAPPDLVVNQPVKAASGWRDVPLVIAGLAAVLLIAMARSTARVAALRGPPAHKPATRRGAHVELVRRDPASKGWSGHVVDADDGSTVPNARIHIERHGFDGVNVLFRTTSDALGRFALAPVHSLPGDELVADAPLHGLLRGPLPADGELSVALVLRRRALLDRLVTWARRRGRPFDVAAEPTPAQVRRAARADPDVIRWADAVELAAFGGRVVDEQAQEDVDSLAPGGPPDEHAPRPAQRSAPPGGKTRRP